MKKIISLKICVLGLLLAGCGSLSKGVEDPYETFQGNWAINIFFYDNDEEKFIDNKSEIDKFIDEIYDDSDFKVSSSTALMQVNNDIATSRSIKDDPEFGWSLKEFEILESREGTIEVHHIDEDYDYDFTSTIKFLDEDTFIMMYEVRLENEYLKYNGMGSRVSAKEGNEWIDYEEDDPKIDRWEELTYSMLCNKRALSEAKEYFGQPFLLESEDKIKELSDKEIKLYYGVFGK